MKDWFLYLLLAVGVALRILYLPVAIRTPDERSYTVFAATLERDGLKALPVMVREYLQRPELHAYPSPTRLAPALLGATAMRLTGERTPLALAWISTLASALLMLLMLRLGTRFLDRWSTAVALVFVVASPLDLAMARRAWGDELLALVALAMLYAFLRQQADSRRFGWGLVCLGLGVVSLFIKETGALFLGLAICTLAWSAYGSRGARGVALALEGGAVAVAVGAGALAAAYGGVRPLGGVLASLARAGTPNAYMLHYQMGGPDYYVRGLAVLQPVPMLLGLLGAVLALARMASARAGASRPERCTALVSLSVFVLIFAAAAMAYPQKNLRFVSALYAPLYLIAGSLVVDTVGALRRRVSVTVARITLSAVVVVLVFSVFADRACFEHWFVQRWVPDLATPWFTQVPPPARPGRTPPVR